MADIYYREKDILDKARGTDAYFAVKSILAGIEPIRGTAAGTEYIDRSAAIEAVTEIVEKTMRVMKKDRFAAGVLMPAMALADLECIPLQSPCALCIHNPPSSTDGKPCCICPACGGKLESLPAADDLQVTCYEPEEEH